MLYFSGSCSLRPRIPSIASGESFLRGFQPPRWGAVEDGFVGSGVILDLGSGVLI